MEIKKYFNIHKEDIDERNRNIFIPICLGNKFFFQKGLPSQNIKEYLNWGLSHTKDRVLFVVVDRIQDTNFFVRGNRMTEQTSIVRVLQEGEVIKTEIKKIIEALPIDEQERVDVIKWEDYQNSDPFWAHITHMVYKEFKNNKSFRDKVLDSVKMSVNDRTFSDEEYLRLCDYVLDEFCLAYSGVTYKQHHYGVYPYPVTDTVLDFIEDIKQGKIFLDIYNKLPNVKTGVVILN